MRDTTPQVSVTSEPKTHLRAAQPRQEPYLKAADARFADVLEGLEVALLTPLITQIGPKAEVA